MKSVIMMWISIVTLTTDYGTTGIDPLGRLQSNIHELKETQDYHMGMPCNNGVDRTTPKLAEKNEYATEIVAAIQERRLLSKKRHNSQTKLRKGIVLDPYMEFTDCLYQHRDLCNGICNKQKTITRKREASAVESADTINCKEKVSECIEETVFPSCDNEEYFKHDNVQMLRVIWEQCSQQKLRECKERTKTCKKVMKYINLFTYPKNKNSVKCPTREKICIQRIYDPCFEEVVKGIACYDLYPTIFGLDKPIPDRSHQKLTKTYKTPTKRSCKPLRQLLELIPTPFPFTEPVELPSYDGNSGTIETDRKQNGIAITET